jgi:BirA family biotin operon repressor/biotin-[acetyl-CoA-carboxylase] ligase
MHTVRLDIVDSTNTYAKIHAAEFPAGEITCITAEEQTAGRGRYQRKWISPPGVNIYATFFFKLPKQIPDLTHLAQLMTFSFAQVLIQAGLHPKIKWPNDILLNGKKVSGVLCETEFGAQEVDIFLGIGINVNWETLSPIDQPATSLLLETGKKWDRDALLNKLQKRFEGDLGKFKKGGFAPFQSEFEKLMIQV